MNFTHKMILKYTCFSITKAVLSRGHSTQESVLLTVVTAAVLPPLRLSLGLASSFPPLKSGFTPEMLQKSLYKGKH